MHRGRTFCGAAALVGLAAGANLMVLKQNVFSGAVLALLGLGALAGLVWVGLVLMGMARHSAAEGGALFGLKTVVNTALFLGICMLLYAFAQRGDRSWDLTQEGRRKLSEQTVQVLETLDKDVAVIGFFLQVDDELVQIAREKTERFLDQCRKYTPRLHVEILDPQVERARVEGLGITHASTQGTIVIRCGTRQKVITLSGASPRLDEKDFTNSLINVIRDSEPRIYFLSGHGERGLDDDNEQTGGSLLKKLLEGEAYSVAKLDIPIAQPAVPTDCSTLVVNGMGVAGPQADLHPEEIKAIQAYLEQGGRLLVLLDPWRKKSNAPEQVEQLLPWLGQRLGIVVGNDIVISPGSKWSVEFTGDRKAFPSDGPDSPYLGSFLQGHRITQNFDQKMVFNAARSVRLAKKMPDKTAGVELLRTTPDFYAETDIALLAAQGKAFKSADEESGTIPMAVAVTMKTDAPVGSSGQTRDARIVVVGDADFACNGQLTVIPGNLNFTLNTIAWLNENEDLIAIRPTGKEDPPVMLTETDKRAVIWIAVLGTVQTVVAAGLIAYFLRRKYQ